MGVTNSLLPLGRCKAEVLLQCVPSKTGFDHPTLSQKGNDSKKRTKLFVLETPLGCLVPPALCVVSRRMNNFLQSILPPQKNVILLLLHCHFAGRE